MARLNIEDSFWSDHVARALIRVLGEFEATGQIICLWRLAQGYWTKSSTGAIPKKIYESYGFSPQLFELGMSYKNEDGDYLVRGAKKNFEWLVQRREAARIGGLKSAESRRKTNGTAQPTSPEKSRSKRQANVRGSRSKPSAPPNPLSLSLSLNTALPSAMAKAEPPAIQNPIGLFISKYVKAFQRRYGEKSRPDLRGKVQGQIKTFLKDCSPERANLLIETYCQMDGHRDWFKTKGHDFGTFMENLNPIGLALDAGHEVSNGSAYKGIAAILSETGAIS